ncbi:MAG: hypothetical protein PHQ04_06620 [Opitutaceae bacterium]|nr:hypothetical protein [Opitutaceae bacterium]
MAALAAAVTIGSIRIQAQAPAAGIVIDSLDLQKKRNEIVAAKGKKVFYANKRFDLDKLPHYVPERQVFGLIRMWGLNYIWDSPLAKYWEEGFRKFQPGVAFEYHMPTALTSTSALVTGVADIGANRKMTFTEILQFERMFSYDPFEIPMATGSLDVTGYSDAMCIFVNQDNPISQLTLKQLDGIFGAAREGGFVRNTWHPEFARGPEENIRTWGQLGLTGEWQAKSIHPHGAVIKYDTATKFADAVLHSSDMWNENTRMHCNTQLADGTWASWAAQIADGVAADRYAIGYTGHFYNSPKLKVVAIQFKDGGPYVEPTLESVQSREYELFQANYWYLNRPPGQPIDSKVKEYLRYVLSREGQEQVVRDGKYLPLNATLVREALQSLN